MASEWVEEASTSNTGLVVKEFQKRIPNPVLQWTLPPSKSHLIRALALLSQSKDKVTIHNVAQSGRDVFAMRCCLEQLGVSFTDLDLNHQQLTPIGAGPHPQSVRWVMQGVGVDGFQVPDKPLNAMNSGTALRFLACLVARLGGDITLDGDDSLRRRGSSFLWDSLRQAGVQVTEREGELHLPVVLKGPWKQSMLGNGIDLDVSRSSQAFSSWMLSSPALPKSTQINLIGKGVSNRHARLSRSMVEMAGGTVLREPSVCRLSPFKPSGVSEYSVPGDASMAAFALLACRCFDSNVQLVGWPIDDDAVGHELLRHSSIDFGIEWREAVIKPTTQGRFVEIELTDANDLLPPMAALMALASGGRITGASHAALKESNRLQRTVDVLSSFGIRSKLLSDGIEVQGGQNPSKPVHAVNVFDDHRLFMTAVLLASKVGGTISGSTLHTVADEKFLERLQDAGLQIENTDAAGK